MPSVESAADELTTISPEAARRRASVFLLTVGIVQLAVLGIRFLRPLGSSSAGEASAADGSFAWIATLAVTGLVYITVSYPVKSGARWAEWMGMTAALAQAIVFIALAVLSVVAGIRASEPGQMTFGVLLFGTVAAVHLFLLRWMWMAHQGHARTRHRH